MTPARRRRLVRRMEDHDYRQGYFESHIDSSIAAQIKANRKYRSMSQKQLAKAAGLFQSQVSKLEDVNHDRWTAKTLRRIARAFDLVLVIRLERFSKALNLRDGFPRNLVEPPFKEDKIEPASHGIEGAVFQPRGDVDSPSAAAWALAGEPVLQPSVASSGAGFVNPEHYRSAAT